MGRKNHGGVVFPPGLERFDDVALDRRVFQEDPSLVDKERFEDGRNRPIRDDRIGAMQDVEEQRLEEFRVLAHALKVETLKARERNRVLRIIEEEAELPAAGPFRETAGKIMPERIRENTERAQRGVDGIQVFDLMIEV